MDTITVLVIEPGLTPEIRRIPTGANAELAGLQDIVGGFIEAVPLAPHVSCYVNDEGKIQGLTPNRTLREGGAPDGDIIDVVFGTFVITGYDPRTGRDVGLTDKQAEHWERVFHQPEAMYRTPNGRIGMIPIHPVR